MNCFRYANGVLDGDETLPSLAAARSDAAVAISWLANSVGVVLEFTESLSPPSWRTETSVQGVSVNRVTITVPTAGRNRFYRLRGL